MRLDCRHDLPILKVMNDDATMTAAGGKYAGMERYEARKAIVKDLEEQGYLLKVEDHTHNVGTCYRCGTTVEPMVSKQWFVKMEPLAKPAIDVVRNGRDQAHPGAYGQDLLSTGWKTSKTGASPVSCGGVIASRRTTAQSCGEMVVAKEAPSVCPKCGSTHLHQDEDTLDTWFSFGAVAVLDSRLARTTPRSSNTSTRPSTLVTGYDIIFFWVARMIFSGLEHMGDIPFNTVLFHGLVRDAQGRKMCKVARQRYRPAGNYRPVRRRCAALHPCHRQHARATICASADEKVIASRNFANKIWNASRFVLMNLKDEQMDLALPLDQLAIEDKWVLTKYNTLVKEVTDNLEKFELGIAVSKLYDFIWDVFCDWYVELAKSRLWEDGAEAEVRQKGSGLCDGQHPQAAASVYAVHHRGNLAGAAA